MDYTHSPLPENPTSEFRPSWRGWIHTVTLPVALILGIILIVIAKGTLATTGSAIFMAASLLLFGISALYHRVLWTPRVKAIFRRLDHANIFLMIAGTYTPLSLILLQTDKAILLLSVVWAGAILGIGFRVFWLGAPRWLYVPLYVALGWMAVLYAADFFTANLAATVLVIVGGVFYSIGALIYGLKRPNPFPTAFGFHEIFHSLTVAAYLCHWVAVLLVVVEARP